MVLRLAGLMGVGGAVSMVYVFGEFLITRPGMKINKSINCTINENELDNFAGINKLHVLFFMSLALSLCIILSTWLHFFFMA